MKASDYLYVSSKVQSPLLECYFIVAFKRVKKSVKISGFVVGTRSNLISFCIAENTVLESELRSRMRRILELSEKAFYDLCLEQSNGFIEYSSAQCGDLHQGRYLFDGNSAYRFYCSFFEYPCLIVSQLAQDGVLSYTEASNFVDKWSKDMKADISKFSKNL